MYNLDAVEFAVLALSLTDTARTTQLAATVPDIKPPAPRTLDELATRMARHRGDFEVVKP